MPFRFQFTLNSIMRENKPVSGARLRLRSATGSWPLRGPRDRSLGRFYLGHTFRDFIRLLESFLSRIRNLGEKNGRKKERQHK